MSDETVFNPGLGLGLTNPNPNPEATLAANDIQQAVDQKWSYQSTDELTIRTNCSNCTNRKA